MESLLHRYNRTEVLYDLDTFLTDFTLQESAVPLNEKKYESIDKAYCLGETPLFSVFEVHHHHVADARVALTKQAVEIMKSRQKFTECALFFFVPKNSDSFRISLVTVDWADNKKASNPRRFSFLVGENQKIHTASQQLSSSVRSREDLLKRFSIEVVNDEFYKKISEHFENLLKQIDYPNVCEQAKQEEAKRNFAVRLIGRLIFCWFLKKKLRQDGSPLIPESLLSSCIVGEYDNYYHDVLEPLFFETLNKPFEDRIAKCKMGDFQNIPFLNGGLFEAHLPEDGYKYGKTTETCTIQNNWFINFFETLETYNFTIDENTSTDIDLAVDPEMLGRIFENLLASINPETKESVRKATGSYYTPREIVDYMVTQSLKQYLYTKTDISHGVIDSLFDFEDGTISDADKQKIQKALLTIKVLDPAVGSGAFPMGMLQKMLAVLNRMGLSTQNSINKTLDYQHKLDIIQHCIYGVDIQPMAIEICRLRFFLTLIVDESSDNPQPLPNLNFNFACANSLVGLQQPKQETELFSQRTELIEELKRVRKSYFNSSAEEKERLKQKFYEIQKQIWLRTFHTEQQYLIEDSRFKSKQQAQNKEYADELSSWDPFSYQSNKWFDPFWMFGVENGFDIVIANPPYIGEKGHREIFKPVQNSLLKNFYKGKMDFFYFFFHLSLNLLKDNGICSFITTNYFITATHAIKLRQDLYNRAHAISFVNFNELKIFKSALGQHNIISVFKKSKEVVTPCKCILTNEVGVANSTILANILGGSNSNTLYFDVKQNCLFEGNERYIRIEPNYGSKILNKMLIGHVKRLGDISDVEQGLHTGADEVAKKHLNYPDSTYNIGDGIFVISEQEKLNLHLSNVENKKIKPFFKNSDIKQYYSNVKNTHYLIDLFFPNDRNINVNEYTNIMNHLSKYKKILSNRKDTANGMRKAIKNGYWYFGGARKKLNYDLPKIIAPQRSQLNTFGYNEIPWYASADVYFVTNATASLKYILALLNSKLYYFWLYWRGKRKGNNLELYQEPLSEIPIKTSEDEVQQQFITIVDKILAITQADDYLSNKDKQNRVKAYQDEIDQLVYKLYGLTEEEIKIVEKSQPKKLKN